MRTSNIAPAYRREGGSTSVASNATETTTVRSAILKQIRVLQKQEASLGEQLAKLAGESGAAAIQQRIALQQQINSIEQQIKALQTALLQEDADRVIQVKKTDESEASSSHTEDAAASAPAQASGGASIRQVDPSATIGSIIDISA